MSVHKLHCQLIKTTTLDTTFSWNTAIKGSSPTHSLALFASMIRGGAARPDGYTFPLVLKACAAARLVRLGREVHGMAAKVGFLGSDVYVNNALVSFYGRSGLVEDAVKVFDEMRVRDVVSWSSMIGCFVENGFGYDAVSLFRQMQVDGVDGVWKPDEVMMLSVIAGIASLGDLELGKWVRKYVMWMSR
uniref:Pentatricopeptide repeat-containing protein n=1 Tax=Kalanchoe fedtschenkoi TaxID=63787 RepID=A0A7N0UEL4_KALFE